MIVTCLGATRTVTGSSFLVELDNQDCFLVDCGMYQGGSQIEMRNFSTGNYSIPNLKGIFITHAHIDHSGLVPRLVRLGYDGPVYATDATCDLLRVLWLDSAHIQEMEAEWQSRKNKRKGRKAVEPLYETPDAEAAIQLLRPIPIEQDLEPIPGVVTHFVKAGHILGAASLHLTLKSDGEQHRIGFSGDLGRPGQLIVPDADLLPEVDTLFMETTYGSRRHKTLVDSIKELIEVIQEAYREGGKVLIPAFAVERTQEIIYTLARAYEDGEMPADMPVYLDSPLAIAATEIFRQNAEFYDKQTRALLADGLTPINLPTLVVTPSTEESQKINTVKGPAVIIAGSGMANAGRIKHHLKHNLWRTNCHVVIVGFQAQGTTGRRLVEGAKTVKIFREEVVVEAKVHTIGGFSAHADQVELLEWLKPQVHAGLNVYLIHGEESATLTFKELAEKQYPQAGFYVPGYKEIVPLTTAPIREDRAGLLIRRMAELQRKLAADRLNPEAMSALEKILDEVGLHQGE